MKCPTCHGTGTIHICKGPHGTLECFDDNAQDVPCPDCEGEKR